MEPEMMLDDLNSREAELRSELLDLEKKFNVKKEQYLKVQGAIEALTVLSDDNPEDR